VHEVVRHREREVATDRPGCCLGRVRRADRLPQRRNRTLALDDERKRRRGGDEVDQLAEERLLAMLGVVLFSERAVDAQQLRGEQREAAALDPAEDLPGERALHRVGLDQDQTTFDGHGVADAESVLGRSFAPLRV
jgi:hypothetical protein